MDISVLAIGVSIGLVLILLGLIGQRRTPTLLLAGACFLMISGFLLGADGLQYPTGELCVNQSVQTLEYQNFSQPELDKWGAEPVTITTEFTYMDCDYPTDSISGNYAGGWAAMLILAGIAVSFVGWFAFKEPIKE